MVQCCCHIIKLAIHPHRQSHKDQRIYLFCLFSNGQEALPCAVQKSSLKKKILAGITCDTKLRQYHELGMLFLHFMDQFQNCFGVCLAVCNCDLRRTCRYFNKSLIHILFLSYPAIFVSLHANLLNRSKCSTTMKNSNSVSIQLIYIYAESLSVLPQ